MIISLWPIVISYRCCRFSWRSVPDGTALTLSIPAGARGRIGIDAVLLGGLTAYLCSSESLISETSFPTFAHTQTLDLLHPLTLVHLLE